MKPDYYAVLGQQEYRKGFEGIDYNDIDAVTARYHMLAATGHKDDKDTGGNALRNQWAQKRLNFQMDPLPEFIQPPSVDLSQLPLGSFLILFKFKLLKPYISRDDNPFYIIDNPIVRDKVFRYPMVRPTAWKGSLRHALWQLGFQEEGEKIQRLLGTANDDQPEAGNAGRLYFYPTFFTQTSLEIINPHDRKRRVGKNPILMESVPIGTEGTFTLLYVPFDRIRQDATETRRQAAVDLQLVAEGLQAMFLTYGFSAKRTSGYGAAEETLENGAFQLRVEEIAPVPPPAESAPTPAPSLPRYLATPGRLKDEYLNADGAFRERSQRELKAMKKADRQEYEKAQKWWEREGKALAERPSPPAQPPPEAAPPPPQWLRRAFGSFDQLREQAAQVAQGLQAGGTA